MITCKDSRLTIDHDNYGPRIEAAVTEGAARFADEWLPRLLQEDHRPALDHLLHGEFAWLDGARQAEARKTVTAATPQWVETHFRELIASQVSWHAKTIPRAQVYFQRTLRVPDDGKPYRLPTGLGDLPARNLAAYANKLPPSWVAEGGALLPMLRAEAMWFRFEGWWPTALKIGAGTLNAINGRPWEPGIGASPHGRGHVLVPDQERLEGFYPAPGVVRQFTAMRVDDRYTAAEQALGSLRDGLLLEAFPLRPEAYFEKCVKESLPRTSRDLVKNYLRTFERYDALAHTSIKLSDPFSAMGAGADTGDRTKLKLIEDPWAPEDWDSASPSRLRVHLIDGALWHAIFGRPRLQAGPNAADYSLCAIPWFDEYREDPATPPGGELLATVKAVFG